MLTSDRYQRRAHEADIFNRAVTTPRRHNDGSTVPQSADSSTMYTWQHSEDATDSFRHLTKLAEMTNMAVTGAGEERSVNNQSTTAHVCCQPPQRPAARKRKSILPTRCQSQEVGDWSGNSSDEFSSLDDQENRQELQIHNDGDEWMSTGHSTAVCQHDGGQEIAKVAVSEEPLDCSERRHQERRRSEAQMMSDDTATTTTTTTTTTSTSVDRSPLPQHSLARGSNDQDSVHKTCKYSQQNHNSGDETQQDVDGNNVDFWRLEERRAATADSQNLTSDGQSPDNDDDDDDECSDEVHLCTVLGCNATFQSKRSRDRHSANVQLHQKLLSTVATCTPLDTETPDAVVRRPVEHVASSTPFTGHRPTGDGSLLQSAACLRDELCLKSAAAAYFYYMQLRYGLSSCDALQSVIKPRCTTNSVNSDALLQCLDCRLDGATDGHRLGSRAPNSRASSPDATDSLLGSTRSVVERDDTPPRPAPDGTAVCHVCSQAFLDNLVLKEHIEKLHPREMYRCTVPGCDKIFSTRKSRNRHSQNDNLHYMFPSGSVSSLQQRH